MIEKDIESGGRWYDEISNKLGTSGFGIVCVTPENMERPWLMFEAGSLAKKTNDLVVPYLYDLEPTQLLTNPLSAFQARKADREGTLELVKTLGGHLKTKPDDLDADFNLRWDAGWHTALSAEAIGRAGDDMVPRKATTHEVLEGMYELLQDVSRTVNDTYKISEILVRARMPVPITFRGKGRSMNAHQWLMEREASKQLLDGR